MDERKTPRRPSPRRSGALVGGDGAGAVGYAVSLLGALRARRDGMVAADDAHELELGDTPGVHAQRDAAVTELRAAIIAGRNTAIGVWGEDGAQRAGWTGATPTDPAALPGYARAIAKGLLDVGGSLPTAEGASWDPTSLRTRLSAGGNALDAANTAVLREKREDTASMLAKHAALDRDPQLAGFGGSRAVTHLRRGRPWFPVSARAARAARRSPRAGGRPPRTAPASPPAPARGSPP